MKNMNILTDLFVLVVRGLTVFALSYPFSIPPLPVHPGNHLHCIVLTVPQMICRKHQIPVALFCDILSLTLSFGTMISSNPNSFPATFFMTYLDTEPRRLCTYSAITFFYSRALYCRHQKCHAGHVEDLHDINCIKISVK